ncbi:MAG: NADH-quinone oxidoreductase subunit C [Candidatus Krumholzibacteriia bacterium]
MTERLDSVAVQAAQRFGDRLLASERAQGELTLRVGPDALIEILTWARDEASPRFAMLTDISGVDGLGFDWSPRFRVSYHLLDLEHGTRLRVMADTAETADGPSVPTVTGLWELANWNEREVWDLMGIRFAGHPDLRRILMHEDYALGHPLRKEIPTRGVHDDNR